MKKLTLHLKSIISNHLKKVEPLNYRRITALILLPFVIFGLFYVFNNVSSRGIKTYAVDPLIVTYDGGPPPDPMFEVFDMLPGDEVEKTFNVKNDSPDPVGVIMDSVKTEELKNFAGILEIEISENPVIFSGTLQDFFDSPPINLGAFAPGADKNFKVKVKFPSSAGNEYQEAKVVFAIIWRTETPPIELPEECKLLQGIITSVIEGTENDDRISGTIANELILAKGGRDRVDGKGGDDCIIGADGNDRWLDGGSGEDVVVGGNGNDDMDGGEGKDIVLGLAGDDDIDGGEDNDLVYGGEGNDKIDAGNKDDVVYGGVGNDKIKGGSGNDLIYGEEGDDEIDGGSQVDEIYGGIGNDKLRGGSHDDKIYGDANDDKLKGDAGNDLLDGGTETDDLDGDAGTDTCISGEALSDCEL